MNNLVVNTQVPIIKTNFEEVKENLIVNLERYKGIIVTDETLKDCKATQKDLAGLRAKIDKYRKETKSDRIYPRTISKSNKSKYLPPSMAGYKTWDK